ncbi:alpha-1,6-glucosidase domain-containing protein, partial [Streptomyces sp. NPDC059374]
HRVLAEGGDPVVSSASYTRGSGRFDVPARSVAVFSRTR